MRGRGKLVALTFLIALLPAVASGQEAEDFPIPAGYTYCGSWNFYVGGWDTTPPDPGAYFVAFARKLSCRTARRNSRLVRWKGRPHRPYLRGYRCVELEHGYEYTDVRCSKRGAPRRAFRFQTGA